MRKPGPSSFSFPPFRSSRMRGTTQGVAESSVSSASGCADMPPGTSTPVHLRGEVKPSNLSTVCDTHILDKTLPNYRVGGAVSTGTRYASMISLSFSNQRYWLGTFFGIWRCTILYICSSTRVRRGQSIVVVRSCSFRDGGGHSLAQISEEDFVPNTDVEKGIVVFKRMHCQGLAHGSLSTVASVPWTTITGLSFENSCSGKRTTIPMPLDTADHIRTLSQCINLERGNKRPSSLKKEVCLMSCTTATVVVIHRSGATGF